MQFLPVVCLVTVCNSRGSKERQKEQNEIQGGWSGKEVVKRRVLGCGRVNVNEAVSGKGLSK